MISRRVLLGAGAAVLTPAVAAAAPNDVLWDAMRGKAVPGMAAFVIRDFEPQRELVAGVRRLGSSNRVRRGDRWHLGSDGKAITATMIARLVERGVLSWEARVDQMLPQLAETMHADYRDVTLPDLLSHRSGLPENVGGGDLTFFNTFYDDTAPLPQQRLRYITQGLTEAPAAPKHADDSYSNTGYIVAAVAAEQATGLSYEQLMRNEVFDPLRMRSVSFDHVGGRREPSGHVDGRVAGVRDANPAMFTPPGGVRMSMEDWGAFCLEHMRGERGEGVLLNAESYRMLHTAQGQTNAALGWGVQERAAGHTGRALVHAGSDGNWYTLVALFPDEGNAAMTAANAGESMGGNETTIGALRALAATFAAAPPQ